VCMQAYVITALQMFSLDAVNALEFLEVYKGVVPPGEFGSMLDELTSGQHPFIHPSIHACIKPFVCLFVHSLVPSFICAFFHSFIHSFIRSFVRSFIPSFVRSLIHSFIHSFIHSIILSYRAGRVLACCQRCVHLPS